MTFVLASVVLVTFLLILVIVYIILRYAFGMDAPSLRPDMDINPNLLITLIVIASFIIGYGLTLLLSKAIMYPVKKLIDAMETLSQGNYKTRLDFKWHIPMFQEINTSFNKMASELEHTEVLSNDFINNFSHEFKTPISSIAGFARLLKRSSLTRIQRNEYLTIIEEESMRLTGMATSILKLMKVENQTILTDICIFNISEQIRNCVLLLEDRWIMRDIDVQLDFDEFDYSGNDSLLKEVWINLFDNAIKYTPEGGIIKFDIKKKDENLVISVSNTGSEISAENQLYIFNKFYQVDKSHSSKGNGVGLAVVKKVVELHGGNVAVVSGNNKTVFIVTLPN